MRQMIKDLEEKPIEKTENGRLELKGLSKKERRKKKKEYFQETIKDMTPSQKRKYYLYYYKEIIIAVIVGVVLISMLSVSIYKTTRPISISYAVVNCHNQFDFGVDAFEKYTKAIKKTEDDGYQIKASTTYSIVAKEYEEEYEANPNSQLYIQFTTLCASDYFDIVFTDLEGAVYCGKQELFYPLDKFLKPEYYELVKDRIIKLNNMDGVATEYAIDISDLQFAKDLNLGYEKVYIGFPGDQQGNHDRIEEFLDYLFKH